MAFTNFPNGLTSFGMPVYGGGLPFLMGVSSGGGKVFFVDPTNGSDTNNDGLSPQFPFATIGKAYASATSNANDTIVLAANSSHTVPAGGLTVSKNRVNFIGADYRGRIVQQGAKVNNPSTDDAAFVMKVTGTRCTFDGIKFIQSSTDAAALTCVQDGAEGSYYQNCSFTFGVADNLSETTASEFVCGSDSATFRDCVFGQDTLLTSGARPVFLIDQVSAFECKSNWFINCKYMISSSSATASLIKVAANGDVLFSNTWIAPVFVASLDSAGGAAVTNAFTSAGSITKGSLNVSFMGGGGVFGCTNFCAGTTSRVQTYGPVTSAQAGEAGTPA